MSIIQKTKKILFISLSIFLLSQCFVYADSVTLEDPTGGTGDGAQDIKDIAVRVVEWIRNIALVLSIMMIVVAGFIYLTAAGSKRYETASKMIQGVIMGLVVIFMASSLITEVLGAIGMKGVADENVIDNETDSLTDIVGELIKLVAGLIGTLGILMLIIGGIMYMTAAGNDERMKTAKNIVNYSIMGIGISLLAWSIVAFLIDILS